MTPSARLSAAIEVFADVEARRRPAAQGLKDWGLAHRFAGSGDRAAIAGLVYDALRRKASSAWIMGADTPRAVLLGMLARPDFQPQVVCHPKNPGPGIPDLLAFAHRGV